MVAAALGELATAGQRARNPATARFPTGSPRRSPAGGPRRRPSTPSGLPGLRRGHGERGILATRLVSWPPPARGAEPGPIDQRGSTGSPGGRRREALGAGRPRPLASSAGIRCSATGDRLPAWQRGEAVTVTVLVTGATGFVGGHVARLLLERGEGVRCLVREGSRPAAVEGLVAVGAEIAVGDLRDPESLGRAVAGCRVVYHCAADYRFSVRDPREIYGSNVEGTRNVLAAARDGGVERVVYTSSVGALGLRGDGGPADEETPVCARRHGGALQAEQVPGRAGGRGVRGGGVGGGDRESVDAGGGGGRQADAHRADDRRLPEPADAGLRRHRAQPDRRARRGRADTCWRPSGASRGGGTSSGVAI